MKSKTVVLLLIALAVVFAVSNGFLISRFLLNRESYDPQINPEDFVSEISNKYLAFALGKKFIYEGGTEEGVERTEVYVTNKTKKVLGINAVVVQDRVWLNNELVEDTEDWLAQDRHGNVWYFGENSREIVKGKITSTKGSWEAGVNGAKPGIIMKANPKAGDIYRQEYYKDEAEDMAEVVALGVEVKIRYGKFTGCLQTKEWNPLEPGSEEYKYYCPEVGNLVYEAKIKDTKRTQLVGIET